VLDFPLAEAFRRTFATGQWDVATFEAFLAAHDASMHDGPGRVSFLDNHDLNRFLFQAGGRTARLKLAALCQFSLAPTPAIYYGTEIGLSQEQDAAGYGGDAEARRDMPWDKMRWDQDLLAFYRRLIWLRRQHTCLRSGERRVAHLDAPAGTYAYWRRLVDADAGASPRQALLIAFNLSQSPRPMVLPALPATSVYRCLLSTGDLPVLRATGDGPRLALPGETGAVMCVDAR
jgi:cyclomaltodextrinase